jgi:hypothetical protein
MTDFNRNPTGKGGFEIGHAPLSNGGRPKSDSAVKLAARSHALRVIQTMANICFAPSSGPAARIAAGSLLLAYGVGKPEARVSLDVDLARKKISELSIEEVRDMRAKLALAAIDVAAAEAQESEPMLLDLDEAAMAQPVPEIDEEIDADLLIEADAAG